MSIRASRTVYSFAPALALALAVSGCQDAADAAKDKAQEVSDQAADKAKEVASDLGDKAKGKAGELWEAGSGELSAAATDIFAKGAAASEGGVEALLAKGEQLAPTAMEIGKTLQGFVDSDTSVEPIVQNLDDADAQAELDARIKDMPRVETIDGVDVGFKDVTQWDSGGRETESAYLVLWRRDDKLLGLVYRSKKRINIDKVVEDSPKLLGLVTGAL